MGSAVGGRTADAIGGFMRDDRRCNLTPVRAYINKAWRSPRPWVGLRAPRVTRLLECHDPPLGRGNPVTATADMTDTIRAEKARNEDKNP
jgi:hypothetical protein